MFMVSSDMTVVMPETKGQSSTKLGPSGGPRHVVELPLSVTESDRHRLERRFAAANTLRNGILQAALRALDACRSDAAWKAAHQLPRATREEKAVRSAAFLTVRERHGLTVTALCVAERSMRKGCWIDDHITARLGHVIVKDVLRRMSAATTTSRGIEGVRSRSALTAGWSSGAASGMVASVWLVEGGAGG